MEISSDERISNEVNSDGEILREVSGVTEIIMNLKYFVSQQF